MALPGALAQQPVLDPKTGLITRPWLLFLNSLSSAGGGTPAAPANADYVLTAADSGPLPNSRVLTSSTSNTVDLATAGQVQIQRAALTGDIIAAANSNTTALSTTGVTAGTYGDATHVGQLTVDAKGRLTAAANVLITGSSGGFMVVTIGGLVSTVGLEPAVVAWTAPGS